MERIISEQDRIRRAEEIANRRRGKISAKNINIGNDKNKMSLLNKIFIQTIASMCIFGIAYFFSQNNKVIMENIKPILEKDINFEEIYNKSSDKIHGFINLFNKDEKKEEDNNVKENIVLEENQVGIGGADEEINLSQDEQDIAYIKANVSLIVPAQGTITSKYGLRTPTDVISANHAGVDIGANEGTDIIASMEGTVEVVSSYGDYGNHIKITNGDVSTLYAHCSTILVNQGDYIAQGQKIAEVGNTGRTTGPHLHFEISRDSRTIDPQAILEL